MINDDDKKFIKESIDNAIEKKLTDHIKKTEARKRLEQLDYEKRSKEDREKLLAELQERDKRGENTLAQRFEMLKLTIDTAIPDDVKDALRDTSKTIGKGASQVGKGLGTINRKLMLSNPITAMLYNNRDLLGAGWDIAAGGAKMAWGGIKGAAQGAAGLFNMAMNARKAKENSEEANENTEDKKIRKFGNLFTGADRDIQSGLGGILEEKKDWQKQIDDLHKWYLKDYKQSQKLAKSNNEILSKGLGGLGKGMEAVKGFVDIIQSKQKLILGAVMLGAVAILGLAAWFKSGNLQKLIIEALHGRVGTKNTNTNDLKNLSKNLYDKTKGDRHNDLKNSLSKQETAGDIKEVKKSVTIGKTEDGKTISTDLPMKSGYSMKATAGQPYRAPFDLKVVNWAYNEKNPNGIDMEVERLKGKRNATIMNIENPTVVPGQTAKQGFIIGEVPAIGEIYIKDIDKKEFEAYKKIIETKSKMSQKEKDEELKQMQSFMDANQSNKIRNTAQALLKERTKKDNGQSFEDGKVTERDAKKYVDDQVKQKQGFAAEMDEDVKNGMSISAGHKPSIIDKARTGIKKLTEGSENWDRAAQQQEELKKQKKQEEKQKKQEDNRKASANGATIAMNNSDNTSFPFADIQTASINGDMSNDLIRTDSVNC